MDDNYWMNYTIYLADKVKTSKLKIGAVLVSNIVCKYYDSFSSDNTLNWAEVLLRKIKNVKETNYTLYVTINSMKDDGEFDIEKIIETINLKKIYIGLPDPQLTKYIKKDPIILNNNVYRYSDEFQKIILKQNNEHYERSKQNIKNNPYYAKKRISNLLIETLEKKGFILTKNEIDNNKTVEKLSQYINNKYNLDNSDTQPLVTECLSDSFNDKYSTYDYSDDARCISNTWFSNFLNIYKKIDDKPIEQKNIINVGVGSGQEAIKLFSFCKHITFVDIAKDGLEKISKQIPCAQIICSRAEDLSKFKNSEFDLYISLRTYNSSFFDIDLAIREAKRVLNNKGKIIISIANGFLYKKQKNIIPGLIIPSTDFVDIYRGLDKMKILVSKLIETKFINIKYYITNEEIYLVATSS